MAILTLKNVPDNLVARLETEARENRRSLDQETVHRLELSLDGRSRGPDSVIASLRRLHRTMADLPPINDDFLERAKADGRT